MGNGQRSRSPAAPAVDIPPPERSAFAALDEIETVARIGSYLTDLAADRWVSSKSLDAIFGIDAAFERSVESWLSLVHPAEREAMAAYLTDEVLGRIRPFDRQYRIIRPDTGEERWVYGRGTLDIDEHGSPVRMFGTIADITEQVAVEEERGRLIEGLRHSERTLAAFRGRLSRHRRRQAEPGCDDDGEARPPARLGPVRPLDRRRARMLGG
jgi:PAS domain S-box-containing protein